MVSSPKAPTAPDPYATAQAQGAINKETAQYQTQLNMVDQTGPYGSLTYRPTDQQIQTSQFDTDAYNKDLNHWRVVGFGGTPKEAWAKPDPNSARYTTTINEGPRYEAVTTLSPEQQQLADQQFGLQTSLLDVGQGQLNRVNSALSAPMSMQNLPAMQVQLPGIKSAGPVSTVGAGPQQQTSFNQGGNVQNVGSGPSMIGASPTPQLSGTFNSGGGVGNVSNMAALSRSSSAPSLLAGFNTGGNIGNVNAGPSLLGASPAAQLSGTFNRGGTASDIGTDDFSADRLRVEQALMDRMQPYLDDRRKQEQIRLTNQGFVDPTSEGYQGAIDEVNRQENDARMAAILNAGQEQERLFGMELAGTGFNNQAQAQRYGQNLTAQDFQNQARLQQQQSQLTARDFTNQARQQQYNNAINATGFNNQAQNQRFSQNMTAADFTNQARQQTFANQQSVQGFNNDARLAEQQALLASQGFNNQATAQRFGQNMTAQDFQNQARQQAFANQLTARDFTNQARQQQYANQVGAAGFNNQATAQRFGQNMTAADFANQANNQAYQNELAGTGFNNQAQSQIFGQNVAQQQAAQARAEHINRTRQQAIQERVMQRQMPINEIAALMSGSQVQAPTFVNTPQTAVTAGDYQGQVQQNYAAALGQYNQQRGANNALMGSLFGLAGTLGGAAIGGPFGAAAGGSIFGAAGQQVPSVIGF